MSARRVDLENVRFSPQRHAGLWFDRYLEKQAGDNLEPYVQHIELTGQIEEPPAYQEFFNRWEAELAKMGAQTEGATVVARLAAGLGGASVIENGMMLHHTYGVPIIPGSSLKGTARAYAAANLDREWREKGKAFRTLFGGQVIPPGQEEKHKARVGIVVFYDALPIPGSVSIHNEVMTVHHKEYYRGDKDAAPADWDSPTPIPFASASGRFLIALHAPAAPDWAAKGMEILRMALAELGVGGKTSSGFGRLSIADAVDAASRKADTPPAFAGPPPGYEQGMVKLWKRGKSSYFGFIVSHRGDELFVHETFLSEGLTRLEPRQKVYFKRQSGNDKDEAHDVKVLS